MITIETFQSHTHTFFNNMESLCILNNHIVLYNHIVQHSLSPHRVQRLSFLLLVEWYIGYITCRYTVENLSESLICCQASSIEGAPDKVCVNVFLSLRLGWLSHEGSPFLTSGGSLSSAACSVSSSQHGTTEPRSCQFFSCTLSNHYKLLRMRNCCPEIYPLASCSQKHTSSNQPADTCQTPLCTILHSFSPQTWPGVPQDVSMTSMASRLFQYLILFGQKVITCLKLNTF